MLSWFKPCLSWYLRHQDNTEIQPIPWILEEGELPHTEAPCQDLYEGLKGVNPCECVPGKQGEEEQEMKTQREREK